MKNYWDRRYVGLDMANKPSSIYTADISKRIKSLRELRQISQEKFAEMIGLTFTNYVRMENSYQNVTIKHLKKISKVLNVPIDTLVFGDIDVENSLNFDDYIKISQFFNDEELDSLMQTLQKIKKLKSIKK